uniref:Uncharacterized protein n=1 Tax=Anopheles christyi TaxID=43041 RepID=A0A182KFC1_9DIPT
MNPTSLYITTSRLVFQGDIVEGLQDLNRLLPYLRKSLSCAVCCKLLVEPHSPVTGDCQHHICRVCVGKHKKLKPACRFCKGLLQYRENTQLRLLLQCYKSICTFIRTRPVYADICKCANGEGQGEGSGSAGPSNASGTTPNSLMDLIEEGAAFVDDFKCNSGLSKSAYSILPCIFPPPVVTVQQQQQQQPTEPKPPLAVSVSAAATPCCSKATSKPKTAGSAKTAAAATAPQQPIAEYDNGAQEKKKVLRKTKSRQSTHPGAQKQQPVLEQQPQRKKRSHSKQKQKPESVLEKNQPEQLPIKQQQQKQQKKQKQQSQSSLAREPQKQPAKQGLAGKLNMLPNELQQSQLQQRTGVQQVVLQQQQKSQLARKQAQQNPQLQQYQCSMPLQQKQTIQEQVAGKQQQVSSQQPKQFKQQLKLEQKQQGLQSTAQLLVPSQQPPQQLMQLQPEVQKHLTLGQPVHLVQQASKPVQQSLPNTTAGTSQLMAGQKVVMSAGTHTPHVGRAQRAPPEPIEYLKEGGTAQVLLEQPQDSLQKQMELAQQRQQQVQLAQDRQRLQQLMPQQRPVAAGKLTQQPLLLSNQQQRMSFPGNASKFNTSIIRNVLPARVGPTIIRAESLANRTSPGTTLLPASTVAGPLVSHHVVKNSCVPTTPRIVNITTPQEIKFEAAPIKTVSSGSTMYSVLYAESGNKFTIKRKPDTVSAAKSVLSGGQQTKLATMSQLTPGATRSIIPAKSAAGVDMEQPRMALAQKTQQQQQQSSLNNSIGSQQQQQQQALKRKGCRCGNATPTPGKLTCCGQRCPCYVDSKSCVDCKCRGCRNPHRADGLKIRRSLSELLQQYNAPATTATSTANVDTLSSGTASSAASPSTHSLGPTITPVTYSISALKAVNGSSTSIASGSAKVKVISAGKHQILQTTAKASPAMSVVKTGAGGGRTRTNGGVGVVGLLPNSKNPSAVQSSSSGGTITIRPFSNGGSFASSSGTTTTTISYLPSNSSSAAAVTTTSSASSGAYVSPFTRTVTQSSPANVRLSKPARTSTVTSGSLASFATTSNGGGTSLERTWATAKTTSFANKQSPLANRATDPSSPDIATTDRTMTSRSNAFAGGKPDALLSQSSVAMMPVVPSPSVSASFSTPTGVWSPSLPSNLFGGGSSVASTGTSSPVGGVGGTGSAAPELSSLSGYDMNSFVNIGHMLDPDGVIDLCDDLDLSATNLISID